MELNQAIAAASKFVDADHIRELYPFGHGHINDTFHIKTVGSSDFLLQRVNHHVFRDIAALENNMAALADHFTNEMDPTIPEALVSASGKYICEVRGDYWRSYVFQKGTVSYETVPDTRMLTRAGHAFGSFIQLISPLHTLSITIPDFQNIDHRMNQLRLALKQTSRKDSTAYLVNLVHQRLKFLKPLTELISTNQIPARNVHYDTKINNLLFDETGNARYVVDLDTVMPGYVHYDLGDALRTTASNLPEDSNNTDAMMIDLNCVRAFIEGFLPPLRPILKPQELETMHLSPVYMSLIMGIRFLTDYLNGNVYYKTAYPDHNLDRAINQIHLAGLFETHASEILQMTGE